MGVVSKITKRIDIPGESAWADIRMLSWASLDLAKKTRLKELVGMRELIIALRDVPAPAADAARAEAEQDPAQGYDRMTLLREGLVAWSYEGAVDAAALDEPTAVFLARAIAAYSVPGAADSKGPSSPSTGT